MSGSRDTNDGLSIPGLLSDGVLVERSDRLDPGLARRFALTLALALVVAPGTGAGADDPVGGFDTSALRNVAPASSPPPEMVSASDGAQLAVFAYRVPDPGARLVFYHGGGAHSLAGYQSLALTLSRDHGISTYLVDIRGHGRSDGDRGDAPSTEQVWRDVDSVLASVVRESTGALAPPLLLGGHSSGAGLVLNALTRDDAPRVDAVVFVAPELGPSADTKRERPDAFRFADVQVWKFVVHGISAGLVCGHCRAVRFRHPDGAEDRGLVPGYTVNMSLAVSPREPVSALGRVAAPVGVWIAESDELLDPTKLEVFLRSSRHGALDVQRVADASHLSILTVVGDSIAEWIHAETGAVCHAAP